jgi:hypothetical protein
LEKSLTILPRKSSSASNTTTSYRTEWGEL